MSDSAEEYRRKAVRAREKAAETDGVIQMEWLTLAENYEAMAAEIERTEQRATPAAARSRTRPKGSMH